MCSWDEKAKALADICWEENRLKLNHDLSGWGQAVYKSKGKSLDINSSQIRPKLRTQKPIQTKKKILLSPVSPRNLKPPQKDNGNEQEKIEMLIMSLLEKNRHKNSFKCSDGLKTSKKIKNREKMTSYGTGFPRSLNKIKSPRHFKFKLKNQDFDIPDQSFSYRLTGTPMLITRYSKGLSS